MSITKNLKEFYKENLRFGDMILINTVDLSIYKWYEKAAFWIIYNLIRLVSKTEYVHVVMAIGNNKFISFEPPIAKIITLDEFIQKKILVRRRNFNWIKKQKDKVMEIWRNEYEGSYYDISQLGFMLWYWITRKPRTEYKGDLSKKFLVCSVGFAELERRTGVDTFGNVNTDRVHLGDCARNKQYHDLYLSNKEKMKKEY